MCIDPISLTAIGATLFSGAGAAGATAGALGAAGAAGAAAGATAGILGTGITATQAIIGGASLIGAVGAYSSAQSQAAAERANAQAARLAGYSAESQKRNDARRAMATQLATLSSRGLSLDSGAPLALLADSARNSELNALTTRANALSTAGGYDYKAKSIQSAMPFTVAGQLLSGASKLAALGQL